MLGNAPLGAVPLGYSDVFPPLIPEEGGGAAKFPAPFLQIQHDMSKYHKFWFKRWIEEYSKVGLPEEKENNELTIAKLFGKEI